MDVDGGWQVKMKKVSPAWCPLQALQEEEEFTESEDRTCMVCGVEDEKLKREAQLEFCEADVRKPLASAVRVAKAGNGIWLEAHGGYIENLATKKRMEVREENGVYEMYGQFDDETVDVKDAQGRHPSCYQRRLG